jgi:putative transcriptional regulator
LPIILQILSCEEGQPVVIKNNVREFRKQLSLTQEDLAELLGISRQTIIAIENKKYNPSIELALKIGVAFNKPVEQIFLLQKKDEFE